jgi:hypothetical protein
MLYLCSQSDPLKSEVSAMTRQLSRTSVLSRNDYMEMTIGGGQNGDIQKSRSNNGSNTGSDFSSQARTFFQGLVSSNAHEASMKNLGARAVEPDEELQLQEKSSYDTLGPSGSLWIRPSTVLPCTL